MENSKEIKIKKISLVNKDIYTNMVFAVLSMAFFLSLNIVYTNCMESVYQIFVKISYMMYIFLSIFIFEVAYKKDSGKIAIYGIEYMIIAIYILLVEKICEIFTLDKGVFIIFSSFVFPIYYTFKSIIIDTKERKKQLEELNDIKEIVKQEKPKKKLAKKRKV